MTNIALAASEMRYGIVQQSAYGTAEADNVTLDNSNAGSEIQVEHFNITDQINVHKDPEVNGVRFATIGEVLVDTKEAMPTFSLSMPTARPDSLDLFLAAYFQNVVEEDASPYEKAFTLPIAGATQQPDFSSDAGFFFTMFERHPTAARSRKGHDLICQTLTLAAEPGGKININADMVGRGTVDTISTPSGTWTKDQTAGFHFSDAISHFISFDQGATTVSVALKDSWEIQLNQTVAKCGQSGGTFENPGITERGGTFNMTFQDDANTLTAFASATAGTAIEITMAWGSTAGVTTASDGDLEIVFKGKLTEDPVRDKEGIMGTVLTGDLLANSTTVSPITIRHANDIDRAW